MATQTEAPVKPGAENKLYILQQGIVEDAPGGVPPISASASSAPSRTR